MKNGFLKNWIEKKNHENLSEVPKQDKSQTIFQRWKKPVFICCSMAIMICIVCSVTFLALRASGKSKLYGRAESEKPNLGSQMEKNESADTKNQEIVINPDNMEEIASLEPDTSAENMNEEITENTRQWKYRAWSWIGKINSVKMFVLPQLIYRINTIPIKNSMSYVIGLEKNT